MRRLLLIRHASTPGLRRACFAPEDSLDAHGREAAAALRGEIPPNAHCLVAPCPGALQTASLAGCTAPVVEPALADADYGRWTGRSLDDVRQDEPEGVEEWLTDPDAAPHGGESMRALLARVGDWLDQESARDGVVVAVVPGVVVRAAVRCVRSGRPAGAVAARRRTRVRHRAAHARSPLDGDAGQRYDRAGAARTDAGRDTWSAPP